MADRYAHNGERKYYRPFYLVQRVYESPREKYQKAFGGKFDHNPFGYGRLGNYELDYMGSAEFEFGALRESLNRLSEAQDRGAVIEALMTVNGQKLHFIYIEEDYDSESGELAATFTEWVQNNCGGKEPSYDFHERLTQPERYAKRKAHYEEEFGRNYDRANVWWSLLDDVMWAFVDGTDEHNKSHLDRMLASMREEVNSVRG